MILWKRTRATTVLENLKLIFSPYCADSQFVFVFVLNSLIRYTSVIAYMKFFIPPLRFVSFKNFRSAETSVWNNFKVLLLVIIVLQGYLVLIMKKNLSTEFLTLLVNIPSCETHINVASGDCTVRTGITVVYDLSCREWIFNIQWHNCRRKWGFSISSRACNEVFDRCQIIRFSPSLWKAKEGRTKLIDKSSFTLCHVNFSLEFLLYRSNNFTNQPNPHQSASLCCVV